MAPQKVIALLNELKTNFSTDSYDLQECGSLLSKLKVGISVSMSSQPGILSIFKIALIDARILLPTSDASVEDMVIVRTLYQYFHSSLH